MPDFALRIRPHVQAEIDASSAAEARGSFYRACKHLERAHVLAQASTREHVRVHGLMLRFALRHGRIADALGQAWRLAGAALLTAVGLVPVGNTGSSSVNGLARMAVAPELASVIERARRGAAHSAVSGIACRRAAPIIAIAASIAALAMAAGGTPPF